jgi:hypothetical protein
VTGSLLDAVAITLIPGDEFDSEVEWLTRFFASCMAMEPTPPAPPIIRIDDGTCLSFLLRLSEVDVSGNAVLLLNVSEYRPNLSYKASQAVIVVAA